MTTDLQAINNVENFYFEQIASILKSKSFKTELTNIKQSIQNNYNYLALHWQIKNKIKIPAERLLRFFFYRNLDLVQTYPSVLSSDIAFYTKDALINLDAKTIDLDGNPGDDDYAAIVLKNQITFKNQYKYQNSKIGFDGIHFNPPLPPLIKHPQTNKEVPVVSYFIKLVYTDTGTSFELNHYSLTCIPNGLLASAFGNDIIINFKSYSYLSKDMAVALNRPELMPLKESSFQTKSFTEVSLGYKKVYFDPNAIDPYDKRKKGVLWGVIDKKFKVILSGGSARIPRENINKVAKDNIRNWERDIKITI